MSIYQNLNNGIYLLKNKISSQGYVGSCDDFNDRIKRHKKKMEKYKHNILIQQDYNKYGWNNFIFEILEIINPKDFKTIQEYDNYMIERENYWMNKLKTYNPNKIPGKGYNLRKATRQGEQGRKNLSISSINASKGKNNNFYGKKHTAEAKNNMSKNHANFSGKNNPRNTMNKEKIINIKNDIILLKNNNLTWVEIGKQLAKKYNTSTTMIRNVRYGTHYLSSEIDGKYENWIINP